MSAIPEDIHRAAVNLADTLILEREVSGQSAEYTEWAYFMVARAILAERNSALEHGYKLGFAASGEGWNGEYPCIDFYNNKSWIETRDRALSVINPKP